ncbi:hypothetical protein HYX16_02135 [Candidatus Woesearchaeota archaeon]|nr:hypothetical protein [Candidatus Woesearchaeota archaeon]
MNKTFSNLFFSLIVTIVMNGLDMTYHLATSWIVHLNYVAIKLIVIFLSVFLVTKFIGIGKKEGIFAGILGPVMFYLYYFSANPTLNREVFKLDEQFWFIFLHIFFMLVAYFSALYFLKSKNNWLDKLSFIVLASFSALAFDALYFMSKLRLHGIDEETAASMFTFNLIPLPLLSYILVSALSSYKKKIFNSLISGLIASAVIFLFSRDIFHALAAFVIVNLVYYLINNYDLKTDITNLINKKGWLVLAVVTGLIGSFYQFVPRKIIQSIAGFLIFNIVIFDYRIRQNDIILVSTIFLIISVVSFYKFSKLSKKK